MLAAEDGAGAREEAAGAGWGDAEGISDRVMAGIGGVGKTWPGGVGALLVGEGGLVTGAEPVFAARFPCSEAGADAGALAAGAALVEVAGMRPAVGEAAAPP